LPGDINLNDDLKLALDLLERDNLKLVAVKNQKVIFSSRHRSVRGLVEALHEKPAQMKGAYIADRIVGSAAALLFIHGEISGLYTPVISIRAKSLLEENGIITHYKNILDYIKNRAGDGMCPLEYRCRNISEPQLAFSIISSIIKGGEKP